MNTAGLTVSTNASSGMYSLGRSLTGGNSALGALSPASPTAATIGFMSGNGGGPLPPIGSTIALTRNQFALECGGILLDPSTNEVCLLFYPDSSEWRLPMGRPDIMATSNSSTGVQGAKVSPASLSDSAIEPSVAGCEPTAHAAQRQISQITGYRCSHLHPAVTAHAPKNACAYMGPQMVEPLALQIEQRPVTAPANTSSPRISHELPSFDIGSSIGLGSTAAALSAAAMDNEQPNGESVPQSLDSDAENETGYHPRSTTMQFVMSYYYMAWLTQNRFEPKAATYPVGPAFSTSGVLTDNTVDSLPQPRTMPLAEVTWFKVDTAAQVLTHDTDKVALREAIYRLTRFGIPQLPFAYSSALFTQPPTQPPTVESNKQFALTQPGTSTNAPPQEQASAPDQIATQGPSDTSSAVSALSDGATKADNASATANRTLSPVARNFDIIRKTATSLSKRGNMFASKRAANASENGNSDATNSDYPNDRQLTTSYSANGANQTATNPSPPIIVPKKTHVPRVFSMFYKLVGSSST